MTIIAQRCLACGHFRSAHEEGTDHCPVGAPLNGRHVTFSSHGYKWAPPKGYEEPKPTDEDYWPRR